MRHRPTSARRIYWSSGARGTASLTSRVLPGRGHTWTPLIPVGMGRSPHIETRRPETMDAWSAPDSRSRWLWGLSAFLLIGFAVTVAILGKSSAEVERGVVLPTSTFESILAGLVGLVVLFVIYVSTQQEKLRRSAAEIRQRGVREEVLRARLNELAALLDVSGELSQTLDLRPMLELAARRLLPCLEADHSSIVLLNPRANLLEEAASVGMRMAVEGPITVRPGSGVLGHVFETRETMTVEAEEARARLAQELGLAGIPSSAVCAPIIFEEVCLGVFCIARIDDNEAFTAMHARALLALAEQCGAAIVRHFHSRRGSGDAAHVA